MNDLPDDLTPNPELFVDGSSLFFIVQNINSAVNHLNSGLMKISYWTFESPMKNEI